MGLAPAILSMGWCRKKQNPEKVFVQPSLLPTKQFMHQIAYPQRISLEQLLTTASK
jgi:hypothetical protein